MKIVWKDFVAGCALLLMATVGIWLIDFAIGKSFEQFVPTSPLLQRLDGKVVPAVEPATVEETVAPEQPPIEVRLINRELARWRTLRYETGRKVYTAGLVIKTFGRIATPYQTVNAFANSFGSQLMVRGMDEMGMVSANPVIAFGQGFLVGL